MAELKASLKEAKNAIKDKDYEAAMIHCKDALKIDRKNYQALAMFGRACLEHRRYNDSKKALLLATQIDPDNAIAWQGLSSLHEKEPNCFNKEEEIAILNHMIEITKDEEKLDRIYRRLAAVYQHYDCPLEAVDVLESLAKILTNQAQAKVVYHSMIALLESIKEPSQEVLIKLTETYEQVLEDVGVGQNESNYQAYLRLLYKTKQHKRLLEGARAMARIFPTAYPLEWIARSYVELNKYSKPSDNDCEALISEENLAMYLERLFKLYKNSPWGNLAQSLIYLKEGNMDYCKLHMKRGCELLDTNLSAWYGLLAVQIDFGDFAGSDITCRRISSILETATNPTLPSGFSNVQELSNYVLLVRVDSLFEMGQDRHLREALSLLTNVEDKSLKLSLCVIKAQVKLGLVKEAKEEAENLREEFGGCVDVQKAFALIASAEGDYDTAKAVYEDILQKDATNPEALFELGRSYFQEQDYKNALIYLLKAAKFDPKMSAAFLYIGHYYRLQENLEKAKKCYEKALNLNSGNDEAGAALSDVYRVTGQQEENFALLERVTKSGQSAWAWLRMGLHHLAFQNCDEAVKALQRALELNPKDRVCFECLGDGYLARGSHTAALKVFTKATELFPHESLYPRCRIAYINHILGELLLSIHQYEMVLSEDLVDAVRIVALVGLAEVLLTRARKYKQDQLLSNMKDDCLYAIRCLTRAACEKANNQTVWKLIGDACSLLAFLPPSLSTFGVPARLLDPSESDVSVTQDINKDELLLLGGRCYAVGLQMSPNNASLWHDLAVNIFLQGYSKLKLVKEAKSQPSREKELGEAMDDVVERAMTTAKKSLSLDPSSFNAWNTLGIIAFYKGNLPLAQHSFIRSLQLHPTVDAWTHLGAFYLSQEEVHLAHEAFSQAQALDPVFVACWVGQAMVATAVGHYEAFDLYRHTTLLGFHPESCVGFASSVLRIVCDLTSDSAPVTHFMPNLNDSLTLYCREKETDALAQNMLGLTLESLGLRESASKAFLQAIERAEEDPTLGTEVQDGIRSNYSRTLTSLSRLDEAIVSYSKLKEPDFHSQCGLALTLLKASQFEEAYKKYSEACEWYAPDDSQKAHVFVALAFLQYQFKNVDQVKSLLFQSISSSIQGLFALTSLGLIEKDAALVGAALAELEPYAENKDHVHHVAFLKATQATLQGNYDEVKLILSRAIHRHPYKGALWRHLARHLLSMPAEGASVSRLTDGANAAASASMALAQASGNNEDVYEDVVLKAMAHLKALTVSSQAGKKKKKATKTAKPNVITPDERKKLSLIEAQRAVLMCPSKPETWAVLIAALDSKPKMISLARKWSEKASPELKSWMQRVSLSK